MLVFVAPDQTKFCPKMESVVVEKEESSFWFLVFSAIQSWFASPNSGVGGGCVGFFKKMILVAFY